MALDLAATSYGAPGAVPVSMQQGSRRGPAAEARTIAFAFSPDRTGRLRRRPSDSPDAAAGSGAHFEVGGERGRKCGRERRVEEVAGGKEFRLRAWINGSRIEVPERAGLDL